VTTRRHLVWLLLIGVACAQGAPAPLPAPAPAPISTRATADVDATLAALLAAHRDRHEGEIYQSGADHVDPIQSTAKPFTYGLALADHGLETMLQKVGVNATGLPFDSLIASSVRARPRQNPMVSAGAIATTAMIRGRDDAEKWRRVQDTFARFAGIEVPVSREIYEFEIAHSTGSRELADSLLAHDLFHVPCRPGSPPDCFEVPDQDGIASVVSR